MCSDPTSRRGGLARRRGGRRAARTAALLALGAALLSCGRPSGNREPPGAVREVARRDGDPAGRGASGNADGAPGQRPMRVILPRQSPRLPFFLDLRAEMLDLDTCEIVLSVASRDGGEAAVEFSLPEGASISQGEIRQDAVLDAGEPREFRIVARVPGKGHSFVAAYATVGGRRGEAYVEFGERPSAEERGLRVRSRESGEGVLRFGEEDAAPK